MSLLQRGVLRTLWSRVSQLGGFGRPSPALALAGMPMQVPHAASAWSGFQLPDFSIVFAVPKRKPSKRMQRIRRFYSLPRNQDNWELCGKCGEVKRLHFYCMDCFKGDAKGTQQAAAPAKTDEAR